MLYNEEIKLVELCKKDKSNFSLLYDNYVKDIYRYAYSISQNTDISQDAVSHCFLKALENIDKFEFQGKSIKAWLFVITRNYIYHSYSRHEVLDDNAHMEAVSNDESILDTIITEEQEDRVNSLLSELSNIEQEVIRLKIWEEFDFSQISEITNLSLSAVKMKYYRALDKVKNSIN